MASLLNQERRKKEGHTEYNHNSQHPKTQLSGIFVIKAILTPSIEQVIREEEYSLMQSRKEDSIASEEKDREKEGKRGDESGPPLVECKYNSATIPTESFAMLGARSREFARNLGHEGHRYLTHEEAINYVRELAEGHWEHLSEDAINVLRTPMYQEEMRRIYVATMDQGISSILWEIKEQRDSQQGGSREAQESSRHVSPHHISDLAPSEEEQLLWEGTHRYQELTGEACLEKEKEGKETKDQLVTSTSTTGINQNFFLLPTIMGITLEIMNTREHCGLDMLTRGIDTWLREVGP
ncbi:hypothetical protein K435DRAFT_801499 [Dendrothele bispora CBS 962.96]|uniref:Uncharacterized protein n=1 Tax=Dendrothele bispora (strain CBS 962.96) TaxID=1314807 RepID=A0A4V6T5A2_DENBC|nr:hypothetical protein K435DRAFT_801499 [Dendrothele bispora CBS 962.96]